MFTGLSKYWLVAERAVQSSLLEGFTYLEKYVQLVSHLGDFNYLHPPKIFSTIPGLRVLLEGMPTPLEVKEYDS